MYFTSPGGRAGTYYPDKPTGTRHRKNAGTVCRHGILDWSCLHWILLAASSQEMYWLHYVTKKAVRTKYTGTAGCFTPPQPQRGRLCELLHIIDVDIAICQLRHNAAGKMEGESSKTQTSN